MFPLEGESALRNARSIVRLGPEVIQQGYVLEACAYLLEHGDERDFLKASAMRDQITEAQFRAARRRFNPPAWHETMFWIAFALLCITVLMAVS